MTPTQREGHERHKAFRAHIARLAVPDCVAEKAVCKVAPVKTLQPESFPAEPDPPLAVWVERQKQIWFSIVDEIDPPKHKQIRVEEIQRIVGDRFKIDRNDLISIRRTAKVVLPRQIAMYLAKQYTLQTLPELGRRFAGRDHTTVLHAIRKIERLVKTDIAIADDIAALRTVIDGMLS